MMSPGSRVFFGTLCPLTYTPLVEPRSASSYAPANRRIPACLRDTAGSASTTVLPATEPIVVTSSVSGSVWFAIGPRMNSSRATGAQPQNMHFVHAGSITRRQFVQTFGAGLPEDRLAASTMTSRMIIAIATISPTSAPADIRLRTSDFGLRPARDARSVSGRGPRSVVRGPTLVDRLELEVGLAERDHVVVDEILALHLTVVDIHPV